MMKIEIKFEANQVCFCGSIGNDILRHQYQIVKGFNNQNALYLIL